MNRFDLNTKTVGGVTYSAPFVHFLKASNENSDSGKMHDLNFNFEDTRLPTGGALTSGLSEAGYTFTRTGYIEGLTIQVNAIREGGFEPIPDSFGSTFFGCQLREGLVIRLEDLSGNTVCTLVDIDVLTDATLKAAASRFELSCIPMQIVKEYFFDELSQKNKEVLVPDYMVSGTFYFDFVEAFGGSLGAGTGYKVVCDLNDNFEPLRAFHIAVSGHHA